MCEALAAMRQRFESMSVPVSCLVCAQQLSESRINEACMQFVLTNMLQQSMSTMTGAA
jgi:hypothetical protein